MNRWKRLLRDLALLILLGVLIGIIAAFFEIEASTVQAFIIVCCVIYFVLTLVYYFVFMQPYRRRVQQQNADMEAGKTEKALADIQAMQQEPLVRRSRYLTQCCEINLSAAYCRLEQYDHALEILNAMQEKKLNRHAVLVHHMNTCICLFYTGSEQEALRYYHSQEKLFRENRNNRHYGGNLAVLRCWVLAAEGDIAAARQTMEHAKLKWTSPSLQIAYEKLEDRLKR